MRSVMSAFDVVTPSVLESISRDISGILKKQGRVSRTLRFDEYHGFRKSRLPTSLLTSVLNPRNFTETAVQIEVVHVETDLTHEVHFHKEASAYITILGEEFGFPNPREARAFLSKDWFVVAPCQELIIPAGTLHGFTVSPGGQLYFLSVQSPPIVRDDGHDDYFQLG